MKGLMYIQYILIASYSYGLVLLVSIAVSEISVSYVEYGILAGVFDSTVGKVAKLSIVCAVCRGVGPVSRSAVVPALVSFVFVIAAHVVSERNPTATLLN